MILDDIAAKKKIDLEVQKKIVTPEELKEKIKDIKRAPLDFAAALKKRDALCVIAEVKKASPSKGLICADFDHEKIARGYIGAGADAMSVLTEERFFLGAPSYLSDIRALTVSVPLLRKDFIIDEYQIYEAFLLGADAVLLIAALLDDKTLSAFYETARKLGMRCLVEVHNGGELNRALDIGCDIIGINNRNLYTFEEDLSTTERLIDEIPARKTIVSESGIRTREDFLRIARAGADAVLIGEMFMRSPSPAETLQEVRGYGKN